MHHVCTPRNESRIYGWTENRNSGLWKAFGSWDTALFSFGPRAGVTCRTLGFTVEALGFTAAGSVRVLGSTRRKAGSWDTDAFRGQHRIDRL